MKSKLYLLVVVFITLCCGYALAGKPLKVYILSGQSNMEGQARIETFDYIGEDPATAPLLKKMRNADSRPRVCENVWISYFTGRGSNNGEGFGRLTAGYGSRGNPAESGGKIGPEFTFGLAMEEAYDGPVLIIKTAWGGKSLNTDFRPPSAGPYKLNEWQKELYKKRGNLEKWKADKAKQTGHYYRLMIDHVKKVLADPKRVCPAYDPQEGYEIAGFVWFQGWNDMVDGHTYPDKNKPGGFAEYTRLMKLFIKDVRKDLKAPEMPFVIGAIGVGGEKAEGAIANLATAMEATAEIDEFKGNVAVVRTAEFWDYEMEKLQPVKAKVDHRLRAAHLITEEGVMEKSQTDEPGWEPIGKPAPQERTWRYISVDPQNEKDILEKKEKKRYREITLPEELKNWYKPGFDDSGWNSGKAPIGKGTWKHRTIGNAEVKYNSEWGDGEFILMRTEFNVDDLDYEAYRISVLARQGFQVYLNGQKIHTYIWWKDEPFYRPIELEERFTRHIKEGTNVLAVYANAEYDRRTEAPFGAIDIAIEGITKDGLEYVNSDEYLRKQMDKICSRRQQKIIMGCSNGGYHYLGSAKIMAQIGNAFAEAILEM